MALLSVSTPLIKPEVRIFRIRLSDRKGRSQLRLCLYATASLLDSTPAKRGLKLYVDQLAAVNSHRQRGGPRMAADFHVSASGPLQRGESGADPLIADTAGSALDTRAFTLLRKVCKFADAARIYLRD